MKLFAALTLLVAVLFWSHPFYVPHLPSVQTSWVKQARAQAGAPVLVHAPGEPWAHRPDRGAGQPGK